MTTSTAPSSTTTLTLITGAPAAAVSTRPAGTDHCGDCADLREEGRLYSVAACTMAVHRDEAEHDDWFRTEHIKRRGGRPSKASAAAAPVVDERYAEALALCEDCPVRTWCLDKALEEEKDEDGYIHNTVGRHGLKGALTPAQRTEVALERGGRFRTGAHFPEHTATRYRYGCRCEDCRKAKAAYMATWAASNKADDVIALG